MPGSDFFRHLGLFVVDRFFNSACCARFRSEINAAPSEKAMVVRKDQELLDEGVRRAKAAVVLKSTASLVRSRLRELKPKIEQHFSLTLEDCERPQFLAYEEGSFFQAHSDSNLHPGAAQFVRRRRVSVVLFLNDEAKEPAEGCYGGGSLTFYGLLDGPRWGNCPLPLKGAAGLLIAFRSHTLHEVKPVTFGRRYTIVTWFFCKNNGSPHENVRTGNY